MTDTPARHSRATRWLHAGLSLAVAVDLASGIILQAPDGDHPANLAYRVHMAGNGVVLMLALGLWAVVALRPLRARAGLRALLAVVTGMALSGLAAELAGLAPVWHEVFCALVWVMLPGHLLWEMQRHFGRDDGLAEMWSLRRDRS